MSHARFCVGRLLLAWLCLCFARIAPGQQLQLGTIAGAAGEWVTVPISFQAAPGQELAAVQWEMQIPSPLVFENERMVRQSLPVKEAGKSLTCLIAAKSPEGARLRCLVSGGQKPIPTGTMALLTLKIPDGTRATKVRLRLENALAVTRDLKQAPIGFAEAVVSIRAR